jgi:hypothetical protein
MALDVRFPASTTVDHGIWTLTPFDSPNNSGSPSSPPRDFADNVHLDPVETAVSHMDPMTVDLGTKRRRRPRVRRVPQTLVWIL